MKMSIKKFNLSLLIIPAAIGVIASCSSGSNSAPTPPAAAKFAYILNSTGASYTQCSLNESGIESASCVTTAISAATTNETLYGIAFSGNFAYIIDADQNAYIQCNVNESGIESSSCAPVTPLQKDGTLALGYPQGITFNGNYAYVINGSNSSYTQCSVNAKGSIESNTCVNTVLGILNAPTSIAFSGNFAYITNNGENTYTQCAVTATGIDSTKCVTIPDNSALNQPFGIAFNGNFAYISNFGTSGANANTYTQCNVVKNVINPASCIASTVILSQPSGIAINAGFIYINDTNSNSYTQCNITESGVNSASCSTILPTGNGALTAPMGIAFH